MVTGYRFICKLGKQIPINKHIIHWNTAVDVSVIHNAAKKSSREISVPGVAMGSVVTWPRLFQLRHFRRGSVLQLYRTSCAVRSAFLETATLLFLLVMWAVSTKEYCQLENFDASCPEGSVILMRHAEYGRMNLGRCLTRDYYVGCVADVIRQMDQKCSGRRQCHVPVPEHSLLRALACPTDLVAYLDADYTCIAGKLIGLYLCVNGCINHHHHHRLLGLRQMPAHRNTIHKMHSKIQI